MALPATETFTASNGTAVRTLTGWAGASSTGFSGGACTVQNNAAQASARVGVARTGGDWWSADAFDNDQYVEATVTATANGVYIGVAVRLSGTDNGSNLTGYLCYSAPDDGCYIDKYVNGAYIDTLAGPGTAFSTDDALRAEAEGNTIRLYVNGSLRLSVTDNSSPIASGSAGICAYDSGASRIDNVTVGNLSAADATVNVSDSITVSETVARLLTGHINKTETITVGESVNLLIDTGDLTVNVSDDITVTDAPTLDLESDTFEVNVSDGVTVTEQIARLLTGHISVSELVTVIDAEFFGLETPAISVVDSITVTDMPALNLPVAISASDGVTVTDSPALDLPVTVSAADLVEVTEAVTLELPVAVNVSDAIELAENVALELPVTVAVGELVTVDDAPALNLVSHVDAAETVTVTDGPVLLLVGHIEAGETVTVSETATLEPVSFVTVAETVEVSEAVNLLIAEPGTFTVSVNEDVSVTDSPALYLNVELAVEDSITVTEAVTVTIGEVGALEVSVSETVTVTETVTLQLSVAIVAGETVTVAETVIRQVTSFVAVGDTVTLVEQVALDLIAPPELAVMVSDGVQVGEQVTMQLPELFISVTDGVTVGEIVTAFVFTAVTFKEVTQRVMYRGMFKHMR